MQELNRTLQTKKNGKQLRKQYFENLLVVGSSVIGNKLDI